MAQRHDLWPEVSSPPARRVLSQLYDCSTAVTYIEDYERYALRLAAREHEYREWVRERLGRSGLAQQLPGGLAALPDICDAMPQPFSTYFRMLRPRTLEAQTKHIVHYLDWYLEPQRRFFGRLSLLVFWLTASATIAGAWIFLVTHAAFYYVLAVC